MTVERCPGCGGSSWARGNLVVINDPMTGEAHPVALPGEGPADWACESCGHAIARPGIEAGVLDGVMRRARRLAPARTRSTTSRPALVGPEAREENEEMSTTTGTER